MLLRRLKLAALGTAERFGLFERVASSQWRQNRLLILCYHGVSLDDEHEWSDSHISPERLAHRLQTLRDANCAILPFAKAIEQLKAQSLPPRSVAITFDDGLYDFYAKAYPILRAFGVPATLYVPTYYSTYQRPIFDLASSYFLWRGRGMEIEVGTLLPEGGRITIPVDREERRLTHLRMRRHVNELGLSASDKDHLLGVLCKQVGMDWTTFVGSRMLQLMSLSQLRSLDRALIDVQLHTHRHRTPRDKELFVREIEDNVRALESAGFQRHELRHFCYPSGDADPMFMPWLEGIGMLSATTCEPAYATSSISRWNLPRVVDSMEMTNTEFRAWISGARGLLPRRTHTVQTDVDDLSGHAGRLKANGRPVQYAPAADKEVPLQVIAGGSEKPRAPRMGHVISGADSRRVDR